VHTLYLGGGFGRRYQVDVARQAMAASRAVGRPVLVLWSREEDMGHDIYRPAALARVRAGLDADGKIVAWRHRVVGPSIVAGENPVDWKGGVDSYAVEGAVEMPYRVTHRRVDYAQREFGVPVGVMRGVGYVMNAFATESMIDELAVDAGSDPLRYRRDLLGAHPRLVRVLDEAAAMADWTAPMGAGRGRGIALTEAYGAVMAAIVEVTMRPRGRLSVDRVFAAVECGPVVNPAIAAGQVEGAIIFGLSGALTGEVDFMDGAAVQSNWDDYRVLRLGASPRVDVRFLASEGAIGGLGEIGVIPMAPALANAIASASGRRLRSLPLSRHGIEVE
jgi:isoquinoline 1-oxidoreductase subunit beta